MPRHTFSHTSILQAPPEQVTAFHDQPETFSRLTMPPLILQVLRDDRTSLTEGEIEFRLWFGPLPVRWLARHAPGPNPASFSDVQIEGPHQTWVHEHLIEAVPEGTRLTDRIAIEHRPGLTGWLTRLFFDGPLLRMLFIFRHWQTRRLLSKTNFHATSQETPANHQGANR